MREKLKSGNSILILWLSFIEWLARIFVNDRIASPNLNSFNGFSYGSEVTASKDTEAKKIKNDGTDAIKKEDFRKYLENEGILDFVTIKLIGLYKESEKPTGSDYLKNNFNGKEAEEEKKKVQEIEKEKLKLQEEVDKFKLISAELEAAKSKVSELTKEKGELETTASKIQSLEKDNADLKNMVKELKIENGKLKSELKEKETSSAVSSSTTPIPSKDKDEPMDTNNQAEKVGVKEDKSEEPKVSEDKDSATSSSDKFNGFSNGSEVTTSKDTEAKED